MPVTRNMTGLGVAPATANAINGLSANVAGAGSSSQSAATLLPLVSNFNITSGAGNSGVIFAPGVGTGIGYAPNDDGTFVNTSGATIIVYPPTGGKINNGSANTGVNLTSNQKALWWTIDGLNFWMLIV